MKSSSKFFSVILAVIGLALVFSASFAQTVSPLDLPLYFEANENQTGFLSSGSGYQFLITSSGAQINLSDSPATATPVQMRFVGENTLAEVCGEEKLAGKVNYLIGNDQSQWQTGLPTFARVQITDIYPGINLVFHGNQQQLEYDFAIAPGGDPNIIKIRFNGMDSISITPQGGLVLKIGAREILQPKPEIYQTVAGARKRIGGGYKILDAQTVAFETGSYNHSLPLIIDPVLVYSAYFGDVKSARGSAIARDIYGDIYIAGETLSKTFFTTNAVQTNFGGGSRTGDAFVAKLDSSGANLIYLTYLGGTNQDAAFGLAVDGNGNAFVTGFTDSTNFPVVNPLTGHAGITGKFDPNAGSYPADAFVSELSSNGSTLVYSTYLGGDHTDIGYGIAVDSSDNAYITGVTYSTNFPVTLGAFQDRLACTNKSFYLNANAFVSEIASGGVSLVYSTFLGGTNYDVGRAITVDAGNNVYIAGQTSSTNFPTWNIPAGASPYLNGVPLKQGRNDDLSDAFVTKFPPLTSPPPSSVTNFYSTFLGGTNDDAAYAITANSLGQAYVTGFTASTNFPTTNNDPAGLFSFLVTNGSTSFRVATNVFLTKLDTDGTILDSIVFGGRGIDVGYGVAVDAAGDVFVVGGETSTNFPTMNTSDPLSATNHFRIGYDVFVTGISNDWTRAYYSVLLGGRRDDIGYGIALDASTNVFITGTTSSTNFPTQGAGQFSFNGGNVINGSTNIIDGTMLTGTTNAFLSEIALGEIPTGPAIISAPPSPQTNGLFTTFTLTIGATGTPPLIYQWYTTNNTAGTNINLNARDKKRFIGTTSNVLTILDAQLTNTGTYFVTVTNNWGAVTTNIDLTILPFAPQITVALTNQTVGEGATVVFPVTVFGTLPLHYQWQFNGTDIENKTPFSGAKTNTLVLVNAQTNNAGTYSIIVTNNFGAITDSVTLAVLTFAPQIISSPPLFQTNGLKTIFNYFINATGSPPLIYQWQFNGTNLTSKDKGFTGVNSNILTFTDAQTNQSGIYTVIVTNTWGLATTNINETIIPFAPQITVPPNSATNSVGDLAFFSITATGTSPLHYQWQLNGTNLPSKSPFIGATNSTLILTNVQLSEAGTYTIIVTNAYGSASTNASLTVLSYPPQIVSAPPLFQTNGVGVPFSLFISVTGSPPLIYQWQFNGTNLTSKDTKYLGVNSNLLTFKDPVTNQSGNYTVIVTNHFGSAITNVNEIIIPFAPQITVPPTNLTVGTGNTITFPVTATGTPTLHYRWQKNGTNLVNRSRVSGVTTDVLKITDVQTNDSGTISIIVTNNYGSVTDSVTLTVLHLPPQIAVPPSDQLSAAGFNASFTLTSTGSLPLHYQWQRNGVTLANGGRYSGVKTNTFTISNVSTNDDGNYDVIVANAYGSVTTNATLTIVTTPVIIIGPTNQTVASGGTASFSVVATGTPGVPLLYAWSTDGGAILLTNNADISGATNSTITVSNVTTNDSGTTYSVFVYYSIELVNNQRIFTSTNAILTVTNGDPPMSFSGIVQPGNGGGLVISGSGGSAYGTYYVLSSTNLVTPLSSWTPVATNQFDSQGNFIFTNGGQTNQQEFYILKH